MVVYLPRVELGSMPSEGIILSIRLQVDVYFVILPMVVRYFSRKMCAAVKIFCQIA